MTEKRQTSQGYIIRILQHFAAKLRNITNFVMLFQAVMKFLSRLEKTNYIGKSIKHNSKSVNSMFLTLNFFLNVKNIEVIDIELCLIDFPS
jgi:hypothetical protein